VVGHGFEEDCLDTNFVTLALAEWNLKNGTTLRYDQEQQSEILQAAQELKQNSNGRAE
jgi:hypothetical protein